MLRSHAPNTPVAVSPHSAAPLLPPPLPLPTQAREVAALHDPCPLPDKQKKRSLNERERLVYAPMSGARAWGVVVGG